MKEILFRGRTASGKWFYGNYEHYHKPEKKLISDIYTREPQDVLLETVGQFTGLTDKNGKKVFEGDIVIGSWKTIFKVYFDDCYLQFRAETQSGYQSEIDYYGDSKRLEVIGNVFDNPELLEQSK